MNEYEELCYDLELAHRLSNFGCELAEEAIYWKDLASMYHIVEYTNDTTEEFRKAWQNEVKRCVQRIKEDFVVITHKSEEKIVTIEKQELVWYEDCDDGTGKVLGE